jgi:hypothetical protein
MSAREVPTGFNAASLAVVDQNRRRPVRLADLRERSQLAAHLEKVAGIVAVDHQITAVENATSIASSFRNCQAT